jgi:acid phosphatase type 7
LGDVSYANGDQRVWDVYGRMIEPFARTTPWMLAIGNHEYEKYGGVDIGPVAFLARFALPGDERDYVFDYAGVRFVVIDSVRAQERASLLRLETRLAEARAANVRRLIVAQHYPHFGSCVTRGYNVPLIFLQGPLFEKYGVDLVLNGHDHFYERTYPIRAGRTTSSHASRYETGEGPIHLTAGGGGAGLYRFQPGAKPETTCVRAQKHGFVRVRVAVDATVTVEAVGLGGGLVDRFEIAPPKTDR